MNTINILNGVTLASQEEVTGHTGNTTMHLTEEERTAWNSAAAIPDSSGTYTGNNTHAGVETFNGAVVLNGPGNRAHAREGDGLFLHTSDKRLQRDG